MTNISTFLQERGILPIPPPSFFAQSCQKKLDSLLEKSVFKVVLILELPKNIKIFNSRFVDKIKNIGTTNAFQKSKLIVQGYNNHDKTSILTQSPTI